MKLNIAVFFGGKSTEHEVSVISALQAMQNMDEAKYQVWPIYQSKDERFYSGQALRQIEAYKDLSQLLKQVDEVTFVKNQDTGQADIYRWPLKVFPKKVGSIDVFFPILHGNKGENGSIQGFFESFNLPYVGSSVAASAFGMDKEITKRIAMGSQIPVVPFVSLQKYEYYQQEAALCRRIEQEIGYPLIIKPANGGSSIGVEMADNQVELQEKLAYVFELDIKVLVEKKIGQLREVNCSVLGDATAVKASVIEEPSSTTEVLSFADKYLNDASKGMSGASRQIPADISEEMSQTITEYSCRLFKIVGNTGVVRIDYIIDQATDTIYFNEVNTIPGSLAFYLWEPLGLSYAELLDQLIFLATKQHQRVTALNYSFANNLFSSNGLLGNKGLKS